MRGERVSCNFKKNYNNITLKTKCMLYRRVGKPWSSPPKRIAKVGRTSLLYKEPRISDHLIYDRLLIALLFPVNTLSVFVQ